MARKKVSKKKRTTHNPSLKASMRRKGTRIVHGYETARRKSKKRK
jgi:hypothetical protein